MSFVNVKPGDLESFTVVTNPNRFFKSSSYAGVTGSVYVYPRRSESEKQSGPVSAFLDTTYGADSIDRLLETVQQVGRQAILSTSPFVQNSFHGAMENYLDAVNTQKRSDRKFHYLNVLRYTPTTRFTEYTLRKLVVKDILNRYYKVKYPSAQWAYTNYNSINFFTSSNTPNGSALLYPMKNDGIIHDGYCTGSYIPSGAFSFDFYINPRYKPLDAYGIDANSSTMKVGTILHLSSTYALSLVPGTLRDVNNKVDGFRLMLQLSHSADISPTSASQITNHAYPNDLIFMSDDNSLRWNNWHHVVIRWGTQDVDHGSGSFNIDGVDKGTFCVPSSTIAPRSFSLTWQDPSVLTFGNYFEANGALNIGNNIVNFFGATSGLRDGIDVLATGLDINEPMSYSFSHPLNAELHDVMLKRYYMDDGAIAVSSSMGPTSLDVGQNGVAFYVPPFFVQTSPFRQFVGDYGGILQTPFFEVNGTTDDPFNVAMSFGVAGHYINLENFVRDFASNNNPRLHQLTGSTIPYTTDAKTANEFLYSDPFIIKRNLTILPCDDGNYRPQYDILESELRTSSYVDDLDNPDFSLITLSELLNENAQLFGTDFIAINGDDVKADSNVEAYVNEQIGFTPEQPGLQPGSAYTGYVRTVGNMISSGVYDPGIQADAPLTVYNRTFDASSNQVTLFNISNLFYGDSIHPNTFSVKDIALSGSNGHVQITLKDDGYGNLYRADALTPHSTFNSVGNIYYQEGVVVVKSPHVYFFGKEQYEMQFKGEHNIHVMNLNVVADRNKLNSSSNPDWKSIPYSTAPADPDPDFAYITHALFHDDNYNVIGKAHFAQPIMKKFNAKLMFKFKFDY